MELPVKPYENEYDVLVIGGGPAGCAAAVAAAEEGAAVLLLESGYCLGGMQTQGLVTCFAPFGDGVQAVSAGFADRVRRLNNKAAYRTSEDSLGWVTASPEDNKRIYDELLADSGADVLFGYTLCAAEQQEDTVTAVVAASKNGLTRFSAKTFIDCTGDADLCALTGVPFSIGNQAGDVQASSLCFILTNINGEAAAKIPLYSGSKDSPIHRILRSGKWPSLGTEPHLCVDWLSPTTISFNTGHIYVNDPTDPKKVSDAMRKGRKMASDLRDALAETEPEAFGDAYLVATAPRLGTRESRRIHGLYTLTIEDYIARRSFPDEIARNCYFIDVHSHANSTASAAPAISYERGESHGIPFRSLVPVGKQNLIVAGRSLSCDPLVLGALRVMPNCLTTGEAAGCAAVLSVKTDVPFPSLNTDVLRDILRKRGAYIK